MPPFLNLLGLINIVACTVFLLFLLYTANLMPQKGMWKERLFIWAFVIAITLQAMAPFVDFLGGPTWRGVLVVTVPAVALLYWRKAVLSFLRFKFGAPPEMPKEMQAKHHEVRRYTDWSDVEAEMERLDHLDRK